MIRSLLVVFLCALALVQTAHADGGDDEAAERSARQHYERGQKLFNLQKFGDALEQFHSAYDAKPMPEFLFNIGQCHRNLGEYEAAIFSFKKFLKLDPDASNREQVEALIGELEQKLAEANSARLALRKTNPIDEGPRPRPRAIYKRWWFWTGIAAASVAAAGVGIGIYVTAPTPAPNTTFGNIVFGK